MNRVRMFMQFDSFMNYATKETRSTWFVSSAKHYDTKL